MALQTKVPFLRYVYQLIDEVGKKKAKFHKSPIGMGFKRIREIFQKSVCFLPFRISTAVSLSIVFIGVRYKPFFSTV